VVVAAGIDVSVGELETLEEVVEVEVCDAIVDDDVGELSVFEEVDSVIVAVVVAATLAVETLVSVTTLASLDVLVVALPCLFANCTKLVAVSASSILIASMAVLSSKNTPSLNFVCR
jgi:hypothetical protein